MGWEIRSLGVFHRSCLPRAGAVIARYLRRLMPLSCTLEKHPGPMEQYLYDVAFGVVKCDGERQRRASGSSRDGRCRAPLLR